MPQECQTCQVLYGEGYQKKDLNGMIIGKQLCKYFDFEDEMYLSGYRSFYQNNKGLFQIGVIVLISIATIVIISMIKKMASKAQTKEQKKEPEGTEVVQTDRDFNTVEAQV